jgi:glyoxylase-like metal-dependent hydrolase (beta-lactamase superfamily II)
MFSKTFFLAVMMTALAVLPCAAESVDGLPLHVQKIEPGVVRVWVGDHISSTAVSAIATKKGIVVIDSTNVPTLDEAFRKVIARELGRSDFKFLINTHGHGDHTAGNGVYADCQIIAHENVKAMMEESFKDTPRRIEWNKESLKEQNEQLASGKIKEEDKAAANEQLIISTLIGEYLNSSPKATFPTKTFKDKLVLDCGDVTFELYQSGGTHTRSDIFILVPQKGILFTGDMMADKWLTDTPGCLATFAIRTGTAEDYPVLVKNWQALIARQGEIRHYVTGHWNGELSAAGFQNRFDYLKTVMADVEAMAKANGDFDQFIAAYTLKDKFPQLVGSPGITNQGQRMSLQHLYQIFSGKISVQAALEPIVMGSEFQAGFAKLKADILRARENYFYTEAEINGVGYFMLQQLKNLDGAFEIFKLNAELHPNSWNANDSLAEAYYEKGEKQKALELYKKSLELNPGNENGKKFIGRIEQELAK